MEEYIDIVTKNGKPTGKSALKSEIHRTGYFHNTAHIWLYTKAGEILLAQRSANKTICPLLWDVSVAGHVDAGETVVHAAIREAQEEIGLTLLEQDLKKIGVFECFQTYDNGIVDNEFHNAFVAELKVDISKLKLQKEEVEAVKLVSLEEFKTILNHIGADHHLVASNKQYYELVWDAIKKLVPLSP
ncbi:NUDIX hydrolase [Flavobacteriaceae bacterium LMO-SS05]